MNGTLGSNLGLEGLAWSGLAPCVFAAMGLTTPRKETVDKLGRHCRMVFSSSGVPAGARRKVAFDKQIMTRGAGTEAGRYFNSRAHKRKSAVSKRGRINAPTILLAPPHRGQSLSHPRLAIVPRPRIPTRPR